MLTGIRLKTVKCERQKSKRRLYYEYLIYECLLPSTKQRFKISGPLKGNISLTILASPLQECHFHLAPGKNKQNLIWFSSRGTL